MFLVLLLFTYIYLYQNCNYHMEQLTDFITKPLSTDDWPARWECVKCHHFMVAVYHQRHYHLLAYL